MVDVGVHVWNHLKEELALAVDKRLWVIVLPSDLKNNKSAKELKIKTVINLKQYRKRIKFHGVQIFVVLVAYLFPTKINPPQLIFLPILPHRCIQRVIKFSVNIDHDFKIDVSSLLLGDHETRHENILSATSNFMLQLWSRHVARKRLADCINVSWYMHGLLYFHTYSKLPCTVQQFTTLLGLAWFPVPLPCVYDIWYPNGNNKKLHFGGYCDKFYISCIAT